MIFSNRNQGPDSLIELFTLGRPTSLSGGSGDLDLAMQPVLSKKLFRQRKRIPRVIKICEIIRPYLCQGGLALNGF